MHYAVSEHLAREDERARNKGVAFFFIVVGLVMVYYGFRIGGGGIFLSFLGGFFIFIMILWVIRDHFWQKKIRKRYQYH